MKINEDVIRRRMRNTGETYEQAEIAIAKMHAPDGPLRFFFLSFCDDSKPDGERFSGACIVEASSFILAVIASKRLGCNPGGTIQGHEIPNAFRARVKTEWTGRLLTREACTAIDRELAYAVC